MNATTHPGRRRVLRSLAVTVGALFLLAGGLLSASVGWFLGDMYGGTYSTTLDFRAPGAGEVGSLIGLPLGLLLCGYAVARALSRRRAHAPADAVRRAEGLGYAGVGARGHLPLGASAGPCQWQTGVPSTSKQA